MSKTLVLAFHPDIARSRANAGLLSAIHGIDGVEIVDVQRIYPGGDIDTDVEVNRLLAADRLVLQYPMQWYATPAILQAWLDAVLTHMFYISYESEGRRLQGLPVMISVTAGNTPEAYRKNGRNMFTMLELLAPLRAMAHRCGLAWSSPFIVYRANGLSPRELKHEGSRYAQQLKNWIVSSEPQSV
ncbi:NAD(P)H-dependent oxidoreductase [Marinobacter bohaiensis]|uniref:NAD(P)H-dependent oxidoreductase n=1 Tax=Marinobacter bohaiensis TaxID=2201898 RepID=UPI000DAB757B|nr:NAD(P)H-dependent oxidoreductase [Marinobacter bohaiensis]